MTLEYWRDDGYLVGRLREEPDVFSQHRTLSGLIEMVRSAHSAMRELDSELALVEIAEPKL